MPRSPVHVLVYRSLDLGLERAVNVSLGGVGRVAVSLETRLGKAGSGLVRGAVDLR